MFIIQQPNNVILIKINCAFRGQDYDLHDKNMQNHKPNDVIQTTVKNFTKKNKSAITAK